MERTRKFYVDMHQCDEPVKPDDFLVAIGKRQTNSVYHVAEVISSRPLKKEPHIIRHTIITYKSDLPTALKRDPEQGLIPIQWYSREKKKPSTNR